METNATAPNISAMMTSVGFISVLRAPTDCMIVGGHGKLPPRR
jgi:hypothetical protein